MSPLDPDNITLEAFTTLLTCYPPTVPDKLRDLDELRYTTIPATLAKRSKDDDLHLTSSEVEKLVEWKLKHGTFRPKLLHLVQSNPKQEVSSLTRQAFLPLLPKPSTSSTFPQTVKDSIKTLTALKGIGPATASLLLSACFPETVPFFSDELFRWAVGGGKDWGAKIGYTAKEYEGLVDRVGKVRGRLGVEAVDLEKVAWVLGRNKVDVDMEEGVDGVLERVRVQAGSGDGEGAEEAGKPEKGGKGDEAAGEGQRKKRKEKKKERKKGKKRALEQDEGDADHENPPEKKPSHRARWGTRGRGFPKATKPRNTASGDEPRPLRSMRSAQTDTI